MVLGVLTKNIKNVSKQISLITTSSQKKILKQVSRNILNSVRVLVHHLKNAKKDYLKILKIVMEELSALNMSMTAIS